MHQKKEKGESTMNELMLDVGQANELKLAFRRGNWTNEEIKTLSEGDMLLKVREVLLGRAEIKPVAHLIDLDAPPYIPNGWSVVEHRQGGQMVWDPTKVKFHLSKNQKGGKRIEGNKLRKELEGKPVYNANLLDYLYANKELIPEEWKKNEDGSIRFTYFWGTIYRNSSGGLYVRYLCFYGGQWIWYCRWLGRGWSGSDPAAVPAS